MNLVKRTIAISALIFASMATTANAAQSPNFSFKDINGRSHQFAEYRGKWVVVNYWATYCGPCVAELPALNTIAKRFRNEAVVLGIEAGETPTDKLRQFVAQKGLSYTVAPTQDSAMYGMGLIYGVPTTFIVNPQGKVVKTHMGAISAAQLQRYIRSDKKDNNVADKCKNNRNKETC